MKKKYETMFDVNENMKNAWKMMYVFPPNPNFYLSTTFFVSLLIYFLKSNQHQLHQLNYINCYLLSPITSTTYIDANPIKKTNTRKKFFENQKNNNCRLKLSLFYPNILSIVLYVTTYYNILTNWNKKNWDQFSAQNLSCLLFSGVLLRRQILNVNFLTNIWRNSWRFNIWLRKRTHFMTIIYLPSWLEF